MSDGTKNRQTGKTKLEWFKENWVDATDLILKLIGGIFVPLAILLVGHWLTSQQQEALDRQLTQQREAETAQRNADRATNLLKHVASENPKERLLAIRFMGHFANNQQLPPELGRILAKDLVKDENPEVSKAAWELVPEAAASNPALASAIIMASDPQLTKVVVQAAASNPGLNQSIVDAAESSPDVAKKLPPRIYVHIQNEQQREIAKQLKAKLEEKEYLIPLIQKVDSGPGNNELRYFHTAEQDEGSGIVKILQDLNVRDAKLQYISGYENSSNIRPRHYELWFGKNYLTQ